MSEYRYLSTDILTGAVLANDMPVTVQSASAQINGIGTLSGTLQMNNNYPQSVMSDYIAALEPWKAVFWILQDDVPVWCGPVTSWMPTTMQGGQLPFQASTMEGMFQYRVISDNINFDDEDVGFIFRELGSYGVAKTPNGTIAGLQVNGPDLGFTDSIEFAASYYQSVYDAWTTMTVAYDLEFCCLPILIDQSMGAVGMQINLQLGSPLGRPYSATGLTFEYPSKNVIDYSFQRQANQLANFIIATGTTNTTAATVYQSEGTSGLYQPDLDAGYPLLELSVSIAQAVSGQADVNSYAAAFAETTNIAAQISPILTLGTDAYPKLSQIQMGDQAMFIATSPLHPAQAVTGAPGLAMMSRVTGWTLYPPSPGQPESLQITLGGLQEQSGEDISDTTNVGDTVLT